MNKGFLKKITILFILMLICAILCYKSRKYIKFTYITESEYTNLDYFNDYKFKDNCEFTWWWYFPSGGADSVTFIDNTFGTRFKEKLRYSSYSIDKSKVDIIISFGRKLKTIYYDQKVHPNGSGRYAKGMIIAIPVFEKEYSHKIYLYVTDKKYNIYPEEFANDDIIDFNRYGNVRFEEE